MVNFVTEDMYVLVQRCTLFAFYHEAICPLAGEVITQINATDADVDANAEMIFSMSSLDSATSGFFHLSTSGQLVLLRRGLDREKQAKFGFLVTVTNTAPPQLSSTATLVVTILDINDCSPQVRFVASR